MNLVRWDPFRELEEVSTRLNRLFHQPFGRRTVEDEGSLMAEWAPAVDVQETEGEYLIKADLPDVKRDDVRVELQDGMLCLRGERRQEKEEKGKRFHRIERAYGQFERRLALPSEVDPQKVTADFKDGVLRVHLPKSASAKPKAIEVKVS
jgi:HSP20 family protein